MGEPAGDTNANDTAISIGRTEGSLISSGRGTPIGPVGRAEGMSQDEQGAVIGAPSGPGQGGASPGSPMNLNKQYGPVGTRVSPAEQTMYQEMRAAGMDPNNIVDRSLARMGAAFGMPADATKASQSAIFGALTGTVLASVAMEQLMDKIAKTQTAKTQTARTQQGAVAQQTLASRTVGPARQSLGAGGSSNGVGAA